MTAVDPTAPARRPDSHFKRGMSLQTAMFIGVGGQIGSGWLFAVLAAAGIAGPSAIFSWLIGGLLTMLIALAWMEVGTSIPVSGAIVRYPYLSHGGLTGWILGLSYWLANVSLPAIEAVAALTYLGGVFPSLGLLTTVDGVSMLAWPTGILAGIGLMAFFLAINLFGVKLLGETNRWITWWKIIVPTVTFLLLFTVFNSDNFTSYSFFGNTSLGAGAMFEAVAVSGIAFALMGFRGVIDFAGEVERPQRNIPLGTFGCVVIPLVIYVGLQTAFLGAIDWADAGVAPGDWTALAGSSWGEGPLAAALHASGLALLGAFVSVLLLDAILSPGAAGYIYLGSGARVGYGLAVNGFFPAFMARINRHGVPAASAVVSSAIGCLFFLPAPSWYRLVGFISSALVLSTIAASAALVVMRRTAPDLPRPFRLPAARVLAPTGFLAATLIVYWCGFVTLYNLVAILVGAMGLYAIFFSCSRGWMRRGPAVLVGGAYLVAWGAVTGTSGYLLAPDSTTTADTTGLLLGLAALWILAGAFLLVLRALTPAPGRRHLAGGYWIVVFLLGTLSLSAVGQYGPLETPLLPFPVDSGLALVIGLACYFWAVATGFRTEELAQIEADA